MPWTPLHAALGETTATLTFALVEAACAARVTERASLDWKQQLPLTAEPGDRETKERQQSELAKDIAAMANSGGGMIVYGVSEVRLEGTSAADRVVPVGAVDERIMRAIRQVASNLVYPPVTGLDLFPLSPPDDPEQGTLVLLVPDSPDAPHLIHSKNRDWFGVPYRHGPDTEWMVERQIADAYRSREQGRRRRLEDFNDRFARFVASCGGRVDDNWIVAMAVPETPLRRPRDLPLGQAQHIIDRAWGWPWPSQLGARDLTAGEVTRRGLQRYLRLGQRTLRGDARPRARIEVHGDGSIAVGFTRDGAFPEGVRRGQVALTDIEQIGLDLFALLWSTRRSLGVTGDYVTRLSVEPSTQIFRRLDSHMNDFVDFDESHRVLGYGPVDGQITATEGLEGALSGWLDLVRDAVNQAGVASTLDVQDLIVRLQLDD